MISINTQYKDLEQESNWDIYAKDYIESLVEDDAINSNEAGFLQGYNNIPNKTRNDTKDNAWYEKQFD